MGKQTLEQWAASRLCAEEGNTGRALSSRSRTSHPTSGDAKNADEGEAAKTLPTLALPKPNPFIPSEFTIKEAAPWYPGSGEGNNGHTNGHNKADGNAGVGGDTEATTGNGGELGGVLGAPRPFPRRVVRETPEQSASKVTMWHLQDRSFCQPRVEVYLKVIFLLGWSPAYYVLVEVFFRPVVCDFWSPPSSDERARTGG